MNDELVEKYHTLGTRVNNMTFGQLYTKRGQEIFDEFISVQDKLAHEIGIPVNDLHRHLKV